MTPVAGSSTRCSTSSPGVTSIALPTDTSFENRRPVRAPTFTMSPASPPLCETTPTRADLVRNAELERLAPGRARRHRCSSDRPRARPRPAPRRRSAVLERGPVGAGLAEPAADHVDDAGVRPLARARGRRTPPPAPRRAGSRRRRGTSASDGYAGTPSTSVAVGWSTYRSVGPAHRRGTRRGRGCRSPGPSSRRRRSRSSGARTARRSRPVRAGRARPACSSCSTSRASAADRAVGPGDHRVALELGEVGAEARRPARPAPRSPSRTSTSASRSTGGSPRTPRSTDAPWKPSSIASASSRVDRERGAPTTSSSSSVSVPPSPTATTAPNGGRRTTPTSSSTAPRPAPRRVQPCGLAVVRAQRRHDRVDRVVDAGSARRRAHRPDVGLVHDARPEGLDHRGRFERRRPPPR